MPKLTFSKASKEKLATCRPELREIMNEALALGLIDFGISCGVRSFEEQALAFKTGASTKQWPHSKHNVKKHTDLSEAVDVYVYIKGKGASYNLGHCCFLAGIIMAIAAKKGIALRWGGNWDMDLEPITDQNFQDLVHFELL